MLSAWSYTELLRFLPDVMQVFLAIWLFAVGGCVGSFVNVVALRMPAGMGIARSSSRCPVCLHPIRWYDNVPLVGWFMLRGRCRDCGTWISLRYPLVELLVALLFLALALGEGLVGGRNLPVPPDAPHFHYLTPPQYWSLYGYHSILLVTLFTVTLIRFDGEKVPKQVVLPALLTGIAASPVLVWLHPVHVCHMVAAPDWFVGTSNALWGLLAGVAMGFCIWPVTDRPTRGRPWEQPELWTTALCGVFLGWQAVGAVVLTAAVGYLAAWLVTRPFPRARTGPWCGYLTLAGLLYIIEWGRLVEQFPSLGPHGHVGVLGALAFAACGVSLITGQFMRNQHRVALVPAGQGDAMTSVDPEEKLKAILASPSYLPVEYDAHFLQQPELRAVRVQLELLKPEIGFSREGVNSTVVVFGGTQIVEAPAAQRELERAQAALAESPGDPQRQRELQRVERIVAKAHYYEAAREFGRLVSKRCQIDGQCNYVVITGGGPGVMEAANRGAHDVGAKSIGLNITLPLEQVPNPYITPNLCFQFHYFALRKMHFLMRAKALVVFPGGFGTLDELFDALTLRQTQRMQEIPIILFGRAYWNRVIDFQFLADEGVIADEHLDLISYAETPEEAWNIITRFHRHS
jgi:uncharacterized protein (TIGR00730 family)